MIHFCLDFDLKDRNSYLEKLSNKKEVVFLKNLSSKDMILNYISNIGLFEEFSVVALENVITEGLVNLLEEDFILLKNSPTLFIFFEDEMLASDLKKYSKYAEKVEKKGKVNKETKPKDNNFRIVDAFVKKNKIETWILYLKAIDSGVSPEAILGMFFWKIKMMILDNSKTFSKEELKDFAKKLVNLYHKSHQGESDLVIGLEQFILSSL